MGKLGLFLSCVAASVGLAAYAPPQPAAPTYFAEIDANGIALRVIVADQAFINSGKAGNPANWIETDYDARANEHGQGGKALRKNYAGPGYKYDANLDAFIPPQPFPSWNLDEQRGVYEAPKQVPQTGKAYRWNEDQQEWIEQGKERP